MRGVNQTPVVLVDGQRYLGFHATREILDRLSAQTIAGTAPTGYSNGLGFSIEFDWAKARSYTIQ